MQFDCDGEKYGGSKRNNNETMPDTLSPIFHVTPPIDSHKLSEIRIKSEIHQNQPDSFHLDVVMDNSNDSRRIFDDLELSFVIKSSQ